MIKYVNIYFDVLSKLISSVDFKEDNDVYRPIKSPFHDEITKNLQPIMSFNLVNFIFIALNDDVHKNYLHILL